MRGAGAPIPIRSNGRAWNEDCAAAIVRNEILRATPRLERRSGNDGRTITVKSGRGEPSRGLQANHCHAGNERPEALRGEGHVMKPRPTDRRNPDPHRYHEPRLGPRQRRDRGHRLEGTGKGIFNPTVELRNIARRRGSAGMGNNFCIFGEKNRKIVLPVANRSDVVNC